MIEQRLSDIRDLERTTLAMADAYSKIYAGWNRFSEEGLQFSEMVDRYNKKLASEKF